MPLAKGTFTIWYSPISRNRVGQEYVHDITALSRVDLLTKAHERCPEGMFLKAIIWHWSGGGVYIWFKESGKPDAHCWRDKAWQLAFSE